MFSVFIDELLNDLTDSESDSLALWKSTSNFAVTEYEHVADSSVEDVIFFIFEGDNSYIS